MFLNICIKMFQLFLFNKIFIASFWGLSFILTKSFDEKFIFALISFKLGSVYITEDSKRTKKNSLHFFLSRIFFALECAET